MIRYLVLFLFCCYYQLNGATYWVSTTGNNSNSGSKLSPLLTINAAVDSLVAGDSIRVMSGIYEECIFIDKDGTASNPITLRAEYGVMIDGTNIAVPSFQGLIWGKKETAEADYIVIDGFEIYNSDYHGIRFTDCRGIQIKNCKIHESQHINRGQGIVFIYGDSCQINNCEIFDMTWNGINITGGDSVTIENCHIYNNTLHYGINYFPYHEVNDSSFYYGSIIRNNIIHDNLSGLLFRNCINFYIYNNLLYNHDTDIHLQKGAVIDCTFISEFEIYNNTLYNSDEQTIINEVFKDVVFKNNIFSTLTDSVIYCADSADVDIVFDYNCYSDAVCERKGIHSISVDPEFYNNFRLKSNSPCINNGDQETSGILIFGGIVDIGCYESALNIMLGRKRH